MKVVPMKAERRSALGRNQVAQLRKEGWLPAVVYGEGREPVSISISEWELEQHVKQHHKVFHLDIGGTVESAFLQEISWQATTDRPLHADFKRIDLTKAIEADLEVTAVGYPMGLSKGGVLSKDHMVIRISCLPTAIPESLEHDISGLDLDQTLTAGDLVLPEGVTLVTPAHTSICHVAPAKVVVEAPAATEDAAAPAADAKPAS
ncbi:MAG: 50S ribosomal protein L25 [Planctomycetes bacterium]|nr:50S ribosomal protein L25 [Planctomycetota bacterium]